MDWLMHPATQAVLRFVSGRKRPRAAKLMFRFAAELQSEDLDAAGRTVAELMEEAVAVVHKASPRRRRRQMRKMDAGALSAALYDDCAGLLDGAGESPPFAVRKSLALACEQHARRIRKGGEA